MWPFSKRILLEAAVPDVIKEDLLGASLKSATARRMSEDDRVRITLLTGAAATHLQRAVQLAQIEWNVTLLFWGALLTSGISFAAYSRSAFPPMATYIAHYDFVILSAYITASAIFLIGFSINQARSIIETRGQYQQALNAAHIIAGLEPIARTGGALPSAKPDLSYRAMTRNIVWKTKVVSTFLFISSVWAVTQVLANGNIGLSRGLKPEAISLACAFANCQDDNRFDLGKDCLESGTVIWLVAALVVIGLLLRRSAPQHR